MLYIAFQSFIPKYRVLFTLETLIFRRGYFPPLLGESLRREVIFKFRIKNLSRNFFFILIRSLSLNLIDLIFPIFVCISCDYGLPMGYVRLINYSWRTSNLAPFGDFFALGG